MILNDASIHRWALGGGITPYNPGHVNPASIDLTWSGRYRLASPAGWGAVMEDEELVVSPFQFILADSAEYLIIPNYLAGTILLKSTSGRNGIELLQAKLMQDADLAHANARYFDPGFYGTATFEFYNVAPWPVVIKRGQRLLQLVLQLMEAPPKHDYTETGRYNGQTGPTPPR